MEICKTMWFIDMIKNCCYNPRRNKKDEVDKLLNEWIVETYANNKYLHKIPPSRITHQRQIIMSQITEQ